MSLGSTAAKLAAAGVETVGIVASRLDPVRRYFRYRPPRCLVGADPDLTSHRAFGVPCGEFTPDMERIVLARVEDLAREVGLAAPPGQGWAALDREDRIDVEEHRAEFARHQTQFTAQYLIDAAGVIRWANIECEDHGLEGLDRFPSDEELLARARSLT